MNPTEQQEAERLAAYLRLHSYAFTHIPNETGGDMYAKRRAVRMKRAGTSKGFPDYLIFKAGKKWAVELKRRKGGTVSPEQRKWLEILAQHDFKSAICNGADEVIKFLNEI